MINYKNMEKLLIAGVFMAIIGGRVAYAQGNQEEKTVKSGDSVAEGIPVENEVAFEVFSDQEKEDLVKLKKEDPEKFKELVKSKVKEKREYLRNLKESDPEKYKEVVSQAREKIKQRLQKLKEENPEKFEKIMQHRQQMRKKRLQQICESNPEKCAEIKQRRQEYLRQRLAELKETDPEKYEKIMQRIKTGEFSGNLEKIKEKNPELYEKIKKRREQISNGKHKGWQQGEHEGFENDSSKQGIPPHNFDEQ